MSTARPSAARKPAAASLPLHSSVSMTTRRMALRSANPLVLPARHAALWQHAGMTSRRMSVAQVASAEAVLKTHPPRVPSGGHQPGLSSHAPSKKHHPSSVTGAEVAAEAVSQDALAAHAVHRFFMALSSRDISTLLSLLSQDAVLQDLSQDGMIVGQLDIARFYLDALTSLPDNITWALQDCTPDDPHRIAAMWHLEVAGSPVPSSNGITFFAFNADGRITYIRQAPEHWVKSGNWAQGLSSRLTAPLLRGIGPASIWGGVAAVAGTALSHTGLLLAPAPPSITYSPGRQITPMSQRSVQDRSPVAGTQKHSKSRAAGSVQQQQHVTKQSSTMQQKDMRPRPAAPVSNHDDVGTGSRANNSRQPAAQLDIAVADIATPASNEGLSAGVAAPHMHGHVTANNIVPAASMQPEAVQQQQQQQQAIELAHLSGLWEKDVAASDTEEYERALDLWGIQGPQRATARLIEGMEIKAAGPKLSVHFLTVIPMFKVTEEYVEGSKARLMRRDLRSGHAQATLARTARGVTTQVSWQAPHAGQLQEVYELSECRQALSITSTLSIGQRAETSKAVWRRAAHASRDQLLQASEKKHGNYSTILRKFGLPV